MAAQITDDALHAHVAAWLAADRPLVVARQSVADEGIPDTIAGHRSQSVWRCRPRKASAASRSALPSHDIARYTAAIAARRCAGPCACRVAARTGRTGCRGNAIWSIELRVFGSLAWQALSGLPYLTPQSDIDLIWHPRSLAQLQQGIALLASWELASGLRADGEVLFGGGQRSVMARMGHIETRRRAARIGEARIQRATGQEQANCSSCWHETTCITE